MSLTIPPLGDGEDEGDEAGEGDGDDPVMDDTAEDIGEVTEDAGDDSEGAGPTPPAIARRLRTLQVHPQEEDLDPKSCCATAHHKYRIWSQNPNCLLCAAN